MTEPQNVKVTGPYLNKTMPASFPTELNIDAKNAGYGSPEVLIQVHSILLCLNSTDQL